MSSHLFLDCGPALESCSVLWRLSCFGLQKGFGTDFFSFWTHSGDARLHFWQHWCVNYASVHLNIFASMCIPLSACVWECAFAIGAASVMLCGQEDLSNAQRRTSTTYLPLGITKHCAWTPSDATDNSHIIMASAPLPAATWKRNTRRNEGYAAE